MLVPGRFCGMPASCDFQNDTCGYDNLGAKLSLIPLAGTSQTHSQSQSSVIRLASASASVHKNPKSLLVRQSTRDDEIVDWERAAAGSVPQGTAPNASHSHPSGGFFMYVPAQDTKPGDTAVLISESVGKRQAFDRSLCFFFWYQLVGLGMRFGLIQSYC